MNLIPAVQKITLDDGRICLKSAHWIFCRNIDRRVVEAAYRIADESSNAPCVTIDSGDKYDESYTMSVSTDGIKITSGGAQGAFYAIMTLKQLRDDDGFVPCCRIYDAPDLKYRGFYQDVSRGKIASLDTLKSLVDSMAELKLNSLQLYVEHTYEFKEYEFCRDELGYLSADMIRELQDYCRSRFIELIPSISLFGHLYHLLQHDKYKHLSELPTYTPTTHYWHERMRHHTINPLLEESFDIIKSLIDQYLEVTDSDWFNICCDETFDLGRGINADKDRRQMYEDFVAKITAYLNSRGKRVMMWSDFTWENPDRVKMLPKNSVLLSWDYSDNPCEEHITTISDADRLQIMCPGTSSWSAFSENVEYEEKNILKMAHFAKKYSAVGLLNTNWGDFGNPSSITMAMYGLTLGAAVSWNQSTCADGNFRRSASEMIYGNPETVGIIADISDNRGCSNWIKLVLRENIPVARERYEKVMELYRNAYEKLASLNYKSDVIRREVLCAVNGYALVAKWCSAADGCPVDCHVDFDRWIEEFENLWRVRNIHDELGEMLRMINTFENGEMI